MMIFIQLQKDAYSVWSKDMHILWKMTNSQNWNYNHHFIN